jgi:hypothetical protein
MGSPANPIRRSPQGSDHLGVQILLNQFSVLSMHVIFGLVRVGLVCLVFVFCDKSVAEGVVYHAGVAPDHKGHWGWTHGARWVEGGHLTHLYTSMNSNWA